MSEPRGAEFRHGYGPRVHLLGDAWSNSLLARIGAPMVRPPELLHLLRSFYAMLTARVAAAELPTRVQSHDTRMRATTARGVWTGAALDPAGEVVIANVMRAGNVPSLTVFEQLTQVLPPERVRLDHFYFSRVSGDDGRVTGVEDFGSKVGGSIADRTLLLPDPMGATGGTVLQTLEAYQRRDAGRPRGVVAMLLIVTPEFIRRVLAETDDVVIWAGRVDRGASSEEVLATPPGTHLDQESGLDERDYIVPGAGGLGEIINNSWC